MTTRIDVAESTSLLRETNARSQGAGFPLKQVLAEVLGTALLANAVAMGEGALHLGLLLAALVFSLGHVSGGHFNPAVTLGVLLRGQVSLMGSVYYVVAQIAGAFIGGLIAMPILEDVSAGSKITAPKVAEGVETLSAMSVEALYTMVLVLVILMVATTKAQKDNQFFGLAIGVALTVGASVAGPISGGALNPAIGVALPALSEGEGIVYLIYTVGPLVGSLLAVGAFMLLAKSNEL